MKEVELFLGRMQPVHNGHQKIISEMTNPVVVLVKGEKASKDKARNPLDSDYQSQLIEMTNPGVNVEVAKSGFLPVILNNMRKKGQEVTKIYTGADRIAGYESQIKKSNAFLVENGEDPYKVTFVETERVTNATDVRSAIREGNLEEFKKLVPSELWGEWGKLRRVMLQVEKSDFKSFEEWMDENATSVASNVSGKDRPLFVAKKRKKKGVVVKTKN